MYIKLIYVLFALFALSNARRHHPSDLENEIEDGLKGQFEIFGHHESGRNALCDTLRCKRNEVCLVKSGNAICIKKRDLFERTSNLPEWLLREKHGQVHYNNQDTDDTDMAVKEEKDKYVKEKHQSANEFHKPYFTKKTKKAEQHSKHNHFRNRHMTNSVDTSCTDDQLDAIGNRLKIWFGNIHRSQRNVVVPVSRHHISCDKEVGWMFGKLDGDEDGVLTPDELESMENDPYEHCLRPFMDRCDTDADDEIDVDEFCDCFAFSGKERDEPPCHKVSHKTDPHLLGAYHPRCDLEGNYKPVQCHERTCWCADKLGREFDGSRVHNKRPDCGQYEEDDDEDDLEFQKIEKTNQIVR